MTDLRVDFFGLILFGGSLIFMGLRILCLMPNEGSFQALFFKPSFSPHSCSSQTLMIQMLNPFYYPIIPEALFIYFLPVFLSVMYTDEFYCSVFKFTGSSVREACSPTACGKDSLRMVGVVTGTPVGCRGGVNPPRAAFTAGLGWEMPEMPGLGGLLLVEGT